MSAGFRSQIKASLAGLLFKTCWAQYARWGPLGLWKHVFTINLESVTYQTVGNDCVCACVWVGGKTETKESQECCYNSEVLVLKNQTGEAVVWDNNRWVS